MSAYNRDGIRPGELKNGEYVGLDGKVKSSSGHDVKSIYGQTYSDDRGTIRQESWHKPSDSSKK